MIVSKNPVIRCIGALIFDPRGRLLLVKRANEPGRGLWSLPGGRVAEGETDHSAVRREVFEETGLTVTVVTLVSYSAMAGTIGGGGLGDVAIRYGYQSFDTAVMVATVIVLVVVVQLLQMLGDFLARRLSHR